MKKFFNNIDWEVITMKSLFFLLINATLNLSLLYLFHIEFNSDNLITLMIITFIAINGAKIKWWFIKGWKKTIKKIAIYIATKFSQNLMQKFSKWLIEKHDNDSLKKYLDSRKEILTYERRVKKLRLARPIHKQIYVGVINLFIRILIVLIAISPLIFIPTYFILLELSLFTMIGILIAYFIAVGILIKKYKLNKPINRFHFVRKIKKYIRRKNKTLKCASKKSLDFVFLNIECEKNS
jgi:hypothetical protein